MIIKINLLSTDKIAKEERTEYLAIGYAVVAVLLITVLANYALKLSAYKKLETRITTAEAQLQKYQSIVGQVEGLQSIKKVLETKKNLIDSLMASGLLYPKFMETLAQKTPSGILIKTMNTTLKADGSMDVVIEAEALDNYSIADFMSSLIADPDFTAIELGAISAAPGAKPSGSNFKLTFNHIRKKA
jgi:Tfp pilus assembly protein PilN